MLSAKPERCNAQAMKMNRGIAISTVARMVSLALSTTISIVTGLQNR